VSALLQAGLIGALLPLALFLVLIWLPRRQSLAPTYPQDVFSVTTPSGEVLVRGHLRIEIASGILTFLNADGEHTETFSPAGWHRVIKIEDAA
jgi:hypothetical protein